MSILIYALVVLLLVALAIYILRMVSTDANLTNIGSIVLLIVGVIIIANRAGVL